MNADQDIYKSIQECYARYLDGQLAELPPMALDVNEPTLSEWTLRATRMRADIRRFLGFPEETSRSTPWYEVRSEMDGPGCRILRIVFQVETSPPSMATALIYLPTEVKGLMPAMVLGCGHGGSKTTFYNQYACQLYAQLGCAVMVTDPIGQEERHPSGEQRKRGHREDSYLDRALLAGRPMIGKFVYDMARAIDLLSAFPGIDPQRIGCAGSSLGGTTTQLLAAVDERLRVCISSAWAADYRELNGMKGCCWRVPGMMQVANQAELVALSAPHCAHLVMVGACDSICPPSGVERVVAAAQQVYALYNERRRCELVIRPDGGHQPYHISPRAITWMTKHLHLDPDRVWQVISRGETTLGEYADHHGISIEPLYNTLQNHRGASTFKVDVQIHTQEELRVLSDSERVSGPYTIEPWLSAIESSLPQLPATSTEMTSWIEGCTQLRNSLKRLLGAKPVGLGWGKGEKIDTPAWISESINGVSVYRHSLGAGFHAMRMIPAKASGRGMIYLPAARIHTAASTKALSWLQNGDTVAILDCATLNDNELLVGQSATAFNTWLVCCAVDGLVGMCKDIVCHGEVDDVAAWSAIADQRINHVELAARARAVPSAVQPNRAEGVVPAFRRYTDTAGLWALCPHGLPQIMPGITEGGELERLALFMENHCSNLKLRGERNGQPA